MRALRDTDYSVHVVLNSVPLEVAAERAVRRFLETDRFVDPDHVFSIGTGSAESYARLVEKGLVDSYASYSNDVPQGSSPILLESGGETQSR